MAYYRQLVSLCVKTLSTFDPNTTSIEDHLVKFLDQEAVEGEREQMFVKEAVAGCVQYRQLIKVVVSGYCCSAEGHSCLRADSPLYHVVGYLLLFRLEEMGMSEWRKLLQSQHTRKMYKFLSFILREDNLNGWITAEWYKVYDKQFVDRSILSPLKRMYGDLLGVIGKMEDQLNNKCQPKPTPKPHTETAPFNLTQPQPRSVPTPEKIPALKPHRPVPQSTYTTPAEQTSLSQAFKTNRMKAQATLEVAKQSQFSCANSEKSEKTKARMKEIISRRESELQYKPKKAEPVPPSTAEGPGVKLNTAAVLREGARVQSELEQQEKRLASLEAGERDGAEFTRWQEDMKQREAAERLAEVERRHLQAKLSYEEAIIARESHLKDMHTRAQAVKEESERLIQSYFAEREEQRKELRRLVEVTTSSHQSARDARTQLQAMKRSIVEAVEAESRTLMARALEEEEQEMRCKVELIQQIRAMERVPLERTRLVDLTETGGQGLLVEMSVAELKERLALMRVAQAEEKEKRRREITAIKQEKERLLSETRESIARHRKEQSKQTVSRQERRDEVFTRHHSELKEKKISQLQAQLLARRRERERLQAESQVKGTLAGKKARQSSSGSPSPPPHITSTLLNC